MDLQRQSDRIPIEELREIGVRFTGSEPRANDWALVLASAAIGHKLERTLGGWQLLVGIEDMSRASGVLDAYDRENPPKVVVVPAPREYGVTYVGYVVALALLAFHAVVYAGLGVPWGAAGDAVASKILGGQWWRAVTALTLHADLPHVLSNAVFLALFVTLLGRRLGSGVAVALVLLAGVGGNVLNAAFRPPEHAWVGASTAVFAAVGLLGAVHAVRGRRGARWPLWVPLAASLGLLAFLGVGVGTASVGPLSEIERYQLARFSPVDMLAHLFGFIAGVGAGLAAAYSFLEPPRRATQWALSGASLLIVVGAWVRALAH